MKRLLLLLTVLHTGTGLHAQPADLILRNGKVVLVDKNFRVVEAMAGSRVARVLPKTLMLRL